MSKITDWLKFRDDQRKGLLEQIEYTEGIVPKAAEKDWWVTLTLHALFLGTYKDYLIFKGGTSLSKCFNLIERFSEDIDIALAPEAIRMKYDENPSKMFVKKLKRAGCAFTSNELKQDLEKMFAALGVPDGIVKIEVEPVRPDLPDTDPQTLLIHYPSLFAANAYLVNTVRIEVSVRSQPDPKLEAEVKSILSRKEFADYKEGAIKLPAVDPQRTFIEKMFLLHEEFQKADVNKIRTERMSRHLYDLEKMMDTDAGKIALKNKELYNSIISHRSIYSAMQGVDYATHQPQTINFLPPESVKDAYSKDYQTMREVMIYGESLDYNQLIKRLTILLERVKASKVDN